jgi:putative ABC transport system permease protein
MDTVARTLRYAFRSLVRTPAFTLTVVLTLALGIGANSAVFSAIDSILVRPLPYAEPDRLVSVMEIRPEAGETVIAPVRLEEWNAGNSSFEAITGYFTEDVSETTGDTPSRVRWAGVAPKFLEVWRVAPLLGRDFVDSDSATQRPTVVWISERLWRNRFDADPNILERTIRLGDPVGFPFQIVGVLPASFLFPDRGVDVWFPNFSNYALARQRGWLTYIGVGRLRPGVTLEEARADMNVVQARLGEEFPDSDRERGVSLRPLKDVVVGEARSSLWLVFGAVSLLLLIACANIASLLLARAAERAHEVALRRSLGASASTIVGQMLAEAGLLAFAGAGAGLLLAAGAAGLIRALAPDLPRIDDIALDARIVIYTTACAVLVALLCGLVPAVRSARAGESLARAGRAHVSGRHGVQWTLVGVQVALSVTLLAGAGLLLRSFELLSRVDLGFEPERVLALRVSGSNFEFANPNADVPARVERTRAGLAELPGVEAVAVSGMLPGVSGRNQAEFAQAEFALGDARDASPLVADFRGNVSPSYFETVGIPLAAGELCRESTNDVSYLMVNRAFEARFFPDRPVIGTEFGPTARRVVGVVDDAREAGIASDPAPSVYRCSFTGDATPWYLVRTTGDPAAAAASVRAKVRELEPTRTVYELAPLEDHIGDVNAQSRLRTMLLTAFAGTALALACLGIYGTLSYVVGLRRREVGLRVALGALSRDIVAQFLIRALRIVVVACAAGLALSFLFTRFLSGMLYGVSPSDPVTLTAVVAVVVGAAVLAAIVPAASAARVDPMQALREE